MSESGVPLGEFHQRARHSNEFVEHVRWLHETKGVGWRRMAKMFPDVPCETMKNWISLRRRASAMVDLRAETVDGKPFKCMLSRAGGGRRSGEEQGDG